MIARAHRWRERSVAKEYMEKRGEQERKSIKRYRGKRPPESINKKTPFLKLEKMKGKLNWDDVYLHNWEASISGCVIIWLWLTRSKDKNSIVQITKPAEINFEQSYQFLMANRQQSSHRFCIIISDNDGKLTSEVWQNLLTYYANRLVQFTTPTRFLLPSDCPRAQILRFLFDGIAYQQTLSTDPELNVDTDCYRSNVEIWSNLMPIC